MQCEAQEAIAEAVNIPQRTVSDKIADFSENDQLTDFAIFRDFRPEIYTTRDFNN